MKRAKWAAIVAASLLVACSARQPRLSYASDYANAVATRSMPAGDDQRVQECNWLRNELTRQQGLAVAGFTRGTSLHASALSRAETHENIAALESRAANVQCNSALASSPPTSSGTRLAFDACMFKCLQYTDRTKEQCFDACNK